MTKVGNATGHGELTHMSAWELTEFGEPPSALKLNKRCPIPVIRNVNQVLVKVVASSLNPIDGLMVRSYGSNLFNTLRQRAKGRNTCCGGGQEFPIILGRDFSGVVAEVGSDVKEFKAGHFVYGFVHFTADSGSQGEYCVVHKDWIQIKPEILSFPEAASIPYVGMTAWAALNGRDAGNFLDFKDKRFLVLGASGGVGTVAVQYLKCYGAKVITTSTINAFTLLNDMGADYMVDYQDPDYGRTIESHGPYDCILDLAGQFSGAQDLLQFGREGHCKYVTLTTPAIQNLDGSCLCFGGLKNWMDLYGANFGSKLKHGVSTKWVSFSPDAEGWKEIAELVRERKIKPVVEKTYKFTELHEAYERMDKGHLRGKIVIEDYPK